MDIPGLGWVGGRSEEKKQLAAEQRERGFQESQVARQATMQGTDDATYFQFKQNEMENERWFADLNDVNAELYMTLRGFSKDVDGDWVLTGDALCSEHFISQLKPLVTVGTSKGHINTNYDDVRYPKRMQNIFHALVDMMAETHANNGIAENTAEYTHVLEVVKTHIISAGQRAIGDRERFHRRAMYKENVVRSISNTGQVVKKSMMPDI
jgi:hypothetical protein